MSSQNMGCHRTSPLIRALNSYLTSSTPSENCFRWSSISPQDIIQKAMARPNAVGRIMISYLTHLDMEYWGMECCGMSGATTSQYWAGFYVKNDITFIFISTLEEEIRKMPDICLHLITPSLFHVTRLYIYLLIGLDETST